MPTTVSRVQWPTLVQLESLDDEGLDDLPWGVIELDPNGVILRYSAAEARMSGLNPVDVLGKRFFRDVAPCTATAEFEGRFLRGVALGRLDTCFEFDFNFVLKPIRVAVRLLASLRPDRFWLLTHIVAKRQHDQRSDVADQAWRRNVRRGLDLSAVEEEDCAREPISFPGAIQGFGQLIAIDAESRRVIAASEHAEELFGLPYTELLGASLRDALPEPLWKEAERLAAGPDLSNEHHTVLELDDFLSVDAYLHRWDGRVVCELVPREPGRNVLHHLSQADANIQGAAPDKVWQVACEQLAEVADYDQILGYAMEESGEGTVIAETLRGPQERSLLGLRFPGADIPPQARRLYVRNRSRYCPNVDYTPMPVRTRADERALDLSFAHLRSLSPYHIQYQRNLGVHAGASYSVVVAGQLRGLLICQHPKPLSQGHEQRIAGSMVAQFLGRALTNAEHRQQSERQVRSAAAYAVVVHQLSSWNAVSAPSEDLLQALMDVFEADGAALQLGRETWCTSPELTPWAGRVFAFEAMDATAGPCSRSTPPVSPSETSLEPAGVLLIAPTTSIGLRILIFRHRKPIERIWGRGASALPGAVERWVESRVGTAPAWKPLEHEVARQLHRDVQQALGPLLETRHLLQQVMKHAPMGVILCDAQGTIVDHNPEARGLLAAPILIGQPLSTSLTGWDASSEVQPELPIRQPDGSFVPARVHTLSHDLGRVSHVVFLQDLRQIRALERRLSDTARMEAAATLASGLAHDFNNTLSIILSQATLLQEDLLHEDDRREPLADIIEATRQGKQIAHDMLAFSRTTPADSTPRTSVTGTVRESERMLRALVADSAQLTLDLPDRGHWVTLTRSQLQQILFNLVGNAKDAATSHIWVRVSSTPAEEDGDGDGEVLLEVRDDGPGIPASIRERVFEPFFTTKPRAKGTGLGLYTVAGIAAAVGGRVSVENEHGAVVRIVLPEIPRPESASDRVPEGRARAAEPREATRVLLVEDNDLLLRGLSRALVRLGFEVDEACSGEQALERFQERRPDVIVTDQSMEGMSGSQLIKEVAPTGVPCLLLTGHAPPDDLGGDGNPVQVVSKPVSGTALAQAIADLIAAE